jgi:hypothetical protein
MAKNIQSVRNLLNHVSRVLGFSVLEHARWLVVVLGQIFKPIGRKFSYFTS